MKRRMVQLLFYTFTSANGKLHLQVGLMAKVITVSQGRRLPLNLLRNFGEFLNRKNMSTLTKKAEIKLLSLK